MHKLIGPSLLDPRWFHTMRDSKWQTAKVLSPDLVEVEGQTLYLANPHEIALQPSQVAYVVLTSYFYLETQEEQRTRIKEMSKRIDREKQETRERLNRWRDEAIAFNATLHIPVKWVPGIKDVLSGLSETSNGDGRYARTVEHIYLQEDLDEGKLHRQKYGFLCSSSRRDNGYFWSAQPESIAEDGEGKKYPPKVTCKACIKIAQRWR